MRRRSLRLSPRSGATAAGVLFFWATLAAATAPAQDLPAHRELTEADAMSLRMPAVAERLGLSESQRRRLQRLIREHAAAFARLHSCYPRGAQDTEGEDLRRKGHDSFLGLMGRTKERLLDVLQPKQREALRQLPPADFSAGELPGVVEPFASTPPLFDKLGLTQQQWSDFNQLGSPVARLPAVERRPTLEERRKLAELIRQRFEERDRAAREVLTLEQRLILDQVLANRRKPGGPHFRFPKYLWPQEKEIASLRLVGLPEARLGLEVEGCFARLVRKGVADRNLLVHPADRLVTQHAFSPGSKFLATVASTFPHRHDPEWSESLLRVWEVSTGKLLAAFPSRDEITRVAFVDDSILVRSASPMRGR